MANGEITHVELPSDDLERAQAFYAELFGWEMQQVPEMPDYAMFQSGPGEIGRRHRAARSNGARAHAHLRGGRVPGRDRGQDPRARWQRRRRDHRRARAWAATPRSSIPKATRSACGRPCLPELNPAGLRLVDSHAHIQTEAFEKDGDEVLAAAYAAGVERMLVPGFDLPTTHQGLAFARKHGLKTTVGIHPHIASTVDEAIWAEVCELATLDDVVGIGETGLDYDRGFSPREDQLRSLRAAHRAGLRDRRSR